MTNSGNGFSQTEIKKLSVLVPVYKGEQTIGALVDEVVRELDATDSPVRLWEIVLVNDGSPDNSHERILELMDRHPGTVRYLRLYRNFGEHNAVMAGLNHVTGDCVAIIDDDFQNPPSEIVVLARKLYQADYDVVYSYYEKKQHSWFRNLGSRFNDQVATILLKKPKNLYLSSFKVIRTDLVRIITQYRGPYPYIDGLILRSTNRIGTQLTHHAAREQGRSSYTISKLIYLWLNMSTGFSVTPLRVVALIGFALSMFALFLLIVFTAERLLSPLFGLNLPPGWGSIITSLVFFAGLQLSVLGIMGEYLGRLFLTINGEPQFLIRDRYGLVEEVDQTMSASSLK